MKLKLPIVALIAWLACAVNVTLAADSAPSGPKTDIEFAKVGDAPLPALDCPTVSEPQSWLSHKLI